MSLQSFHRLPLALAAAAALHAAPAAAQITTITITGNPLGRDIGARAASSLSGDELKQRRAPTLGETLDGLPGVAGSGFGPNSSRPVIRGLDGDRVRLLDNGGATIDASNLSFDHAVATDPLVAERIEVLRGPAALLYGGNATGGVVNTLDNRIPRLRPEGLSGRAELRLGGAANERAGVVVLDGGVGGGGLAWHADAFSRRTDDLRTPLYNPVVDGDTLEPARRVRNSAASAEGGAVGAGFVGANGHIGLSLDTLSNRYGVTAEPDVTIRLKRDRLAAGGEWRWTSGFVRSVEGQASATRYRHDEVEGSGDIGTSFRSRGRDLRLAMRHAPVAGIEGVWGLQAETLDFSALGEEAFVPGTQTRSRAVFALEEWRQGPWSVSLGGRLEDVRVASDGDAHALADARFGDATSRRFKPSSLSLGAGFALPAGWQLLATLGRTERAPAYHELYANGLHVATDAFEVGDPQMALERSRHAELGLAWQSGHHQVKANLFSTRFSNFIALDATGRDILIPGEGGEPDSTAPEYRFQGVPARLRGLELEGRTRVLDDGLTLDLSGNVDVLRGDNLASGEPLPRLAPTRVRLGLELGWRGLQAGATVRHAARQGRVPAIDTATPASTVLDLWARGRLGADERVGWTARLGNVTNELAYNATAVATIRGLSPQPGRALSVGINARW